jgi:hypothetical protein
MLDSELLLFNSAVVLFSALPCPLVEEEEVGVFSLFFSSLFLPCHLEKEVGFFFFCLFSSFTVEVNLNGLNCFRSLVLLTNQHVRSTDSVPWQQSIFAAS